MSDREHAFPNGTVSVRMHKRKRLTLVADRGEFDALLVERVEKLEHENGVLRRKVSEAKAKGNVFDCSCPLVTLHKEDCPDYGSVNINARPQSGHFTGGWWRTMTHERAAAPSPSEESGE